MPPRNHCQHCQRPVSVCYCHSITSIDNKTPVWILQDKGETNHPLNTAKIAALSLDQCTLLIDSEDDRPNIDALLASKPILIFPSETATKLTDMPVPSSAPLLFLDGTWKKCRKLRFQYPQLQNLQHITLQPNVVSRYVIRKAPTSECLSTLEAIVATFAHFEPNLDMTSMLNTMDIMIEYQKACSNSL